MKSLLIRSFTQIIPERFLPVAQKNVNGQHIPLNVNERREYLERTLIHKKEKLLNNFSPIRRTLKYYKRKCFEKNQQKFYALIGEIALTHAGIEKDIKNVLICDWDVAETFEENFIDDDNKKQIRNVTIEKLFGNTLKKRFIKEIKNRYMPQQHIQSYSELYKKYEELSNQRNEILKASYAFNKNTNEIHRVHLKELGKFDSSKTYEELTEAWIPKISINSLESLRTELIKLRGQFLKLKCEIQREKRQLISKLCSTIGQTYPEYAFKNPYLYQILSNKNVTHNQ